MGSDSQEETEAAPGRRKMPSLPVTGDNEATPQGLGIAHHQVAGEGVAGWVGKPVYCQEAEACILRAPRRPPPAEALEGTPGNSQHACRPGRVSVHCMLRTNPNTGRACCGYRKETEPMTRRG